MVITIFRSRLRPEHQQTYSDMAAKIHALAVQMPGFRSIKTFSAEDGERVSIVEFESEETLQAWRAHPEHKIAQKLGQTTFYSEYQIQTCQLIRQYGFPAKR